MKTLYCSNRWIAQLDKTKFMFGFVLRPYFSGNRGFEMGVQFGPFYVQYRYGMNMPMRIC